MPINKYSRRVLVISEALTNFNLKHEWLKDSELSDEEITETLHEILSESYKSLKEAIECGSK